MKFPGMTMNAFKTEGLLDEGNDQAKYLLSPETAIIPLENRSPWDSKDASSQNKNKNHYNYVPLSNSKDEILKNADELLKNMYRYYSSGGFWAIILSELCGLISLSFTIAFSVIFISFINWNAILACRDEVTCQNLHNSLFINNLYSPHSQTPTIFGFLTVSYLLLSSTYFIYKLFSAINIVSNSIEMEKFYREILGINSKDISSFQWFEVVDRLIYLNSCRAFNISYNDKITAHDIVLRIMRKDNYLIGLINKNLLDLFIPWWMSPFLSEKLFLTKSLEWSLSFCIMDYMLTDENEISEEFLNDIHGLKLRFQMVGLINLILLPFMLVFMSTHFFLSNAQHFHSTKSYLGPRQWSPLALWKFREFNELPHIFELRMNKANAPANSYILSFHNNYLAILADCSMYISGSFIAILLLLSFLSEDVLLYMHMGEHNLLWFLGVFSAIYAGSRSFIPDDSKVEQSKEELLNQLASHTHYFPIHWVNKANNIETKEEICDLFQYKVRIFLMEIFSVLLTPIVLLYSMPSCASAILQFFRDHTKHVEGVGAVCDYSLFEFDRYGDEQFGAVTSGLLDPSHKPDDGKLEKSYLNFQNNYPNCKSKDKENDIAVNIHNYRDMKCHVRDQLFVSAIEKSLVYPVNNVYNSDNNKAVGYSSPNSNSNYLVDSKFPSVYESKSDMSPNAKEKGSQSPIPLSIALSNMRSSYLNDMNGSGRNNLSPDLPSVLMSIFKKENIDYHNDFYWLNQFQQERLRDPSVKNDSSSLQSRQFILQNSQYPNNRNMQFPFSNQSLTLDSTEEETV